MDSPRARGDMMAVEGWGYPRSYACFTGIMYAAVRWSCPGITCRLGYVLTEISIWVRVASDRS